MTAIRTENLRYVYGPGTPFEKVAVDDFTVSIEQGAFVGVIGHTGSGKSTFISHLNGLLKPTSGKVFINGHDIWADPSKLRAFRFQVGLVFQYPEHQLFEETIARDIAFGPANMGLSQAEIRERVAEAAGFVGLSPDLMDKSPFELSGGQKRRVAIAGVMAMRPDILVLDEPTAGLDPRGRNDILAQVAEYRRKTGSTVLLVSHSMEDIARMADRVLVISEGRPFCYGTVDEVFSKVGELSKMGLALPQITRICYNLSKRGFAVSPHVFTVGAAKAEILRVLSGGGVPDAR